MNDHKNTILAVILSGMVLIGWQYFFVVPQAEKQKQAQLAQQAQQVQQPQTPGAPASGTPAPQAGAVATPPKPAAPTVLQTREAAIAATPRIRIESPSLIGSIALKGARIDDLSLVKYRVTVDPKSPAVTLLSPPNGPDGYYAEFAWLAGGPSIRVPGPETEWTQEGRGSLTPETPVTLTYDNGEGLVFRRTIAIDDRFLFTVKDEVRNNGSAAVTLFPYAGIARYGTPHTDGFYILHEGLIGKIGDQKLVELKYSEMEKEKVRKENGVNGWLGITDKYWATALLPDTSAKLNAEFSMDLQGTTRVYKTRYNLADPQVVAPGGTGKAEGRLFAGAKEAGIVGINFPLLGLGGYNEKLGLNHFDLLIDWGWFYFITKPMFLAIDYLFHLVGNFGIAILLVTVIVKLLFFPLANKSYASMAKMKNVQPEMTALRERYPDDKQKQQQEMMALYKREKINPVAGCLPILIQIPVFFALYKVIFITIEMRHAPFYGWIHDLSAQDPTNLFTLFGLLPYDPTALPLLGHYLHLGFWPLIMGVTMWVQMKLNPAPPDPTQKMIFDWMPLIFTFMLASFPAGLVIYWAWNNLLSVIQQSIIMKKNGAKIELFDNIRSTFRKGGPPDSGNPSARQDNKPKDQQDNKPAKGKGKSGKDSAQATAAPSKT